MEKPIEHLQSVVNSSAKFKTSAFLELNGILKEIELTCDQQGQFIHIYVYKCPGAFVYDHFRALTAEDAFQTIMSKSAGGILHLSSMIVSQDGNFALPGSELYTITRESWADALLKGSATASRDLIGAPQKVRDELLTAHKKEFKKKMLDQLVSGKSGIENWNSAAEEVPGEFAAVYWTESDLSGFDLSGVQMNYMKFNGSNFSGSNLRKASFMGSLLVKANFRTADMERSFLDRVSADCADFSQARLVKASLRTADLRNCLFDQTDLSQANLSNSLLHGANFMTAILKDTRMDGARYDESTKLPGEFPQWSQLHWEGKGVDPYRQHIKQMISKTTARDFEDFLAFLRLEVNQRLLDNALNMLKNERFQLFMERHGTSIVGVVKNPRHQEVAYVCALFEDGRFSCCTQNLNGCMALRGSLCKHLLLFIIGLTMAGEIDPTNALRWILASKLEKPSLDKEASTNIILKYKKAKAGETNWTPIVTMQKDYCSL